MTRPQYGSLVLIATATAVAACASPGIDVSPVLEINGDRVDVDESGNHERGLVHMQAGRLGRALQEFRHALRENPDSTETLNAIAVAYDLMSRFEMAHYYYERALALNPSSFQTLNNLGRSYLAKGSVQMASKYLERARSIDPSDPRLKDNLELLAAMEYSWQLQPVQAADTTAVAAALAENAWIERTSAVEQTLVTTASPVAVEALATLNVDPRTVSFKADLGHVRSEPTEPDGLMKSGSPTPSLQDPARSEATALGSSEDMRSDEWFWQRVVANDETVAPFSKTTPEPILVKTLDQVPGVSHEQLNSMHTEFVAVPPQPVFVRHSPRAIGDEPEVPETAANMPATNAPEPDQSMSLRLDVDVASAQDAPYGAMSAAVIVPQDANNAPVLARYGASNPAGEEIESLVPRTTATPTERQGQRTRRGTDADDALSTKALNACSLRRVKSGLPSAPAAASPAAMALMEVSNGVGRYRMATRMGHYLSMQGFCLSRTSDAQILGQTVSRIFYSSGFENQAKLIAEALPSNIPMERDETLSSDIRLVLGADLLNFDTLLEKGI